MEKLRYRKKGGVHRFRGKKGGWKSYKKGDEIEVDSPEELGSAIRGWELIPNKKKKVADKIDADTDITETILPENAADGVKTDDFAQDVDLMVNGIIRQTWIDPVTNKVYWMDDSGYLSPMNEDDTPLDEKNEAVDLNDDTPPLTLKAEHTGGGWYNVINEKTGKAINNSPLRKKDAEALIEGKIVESSEDMAKSEGDTSGRGSIFT